MVTGLLTTSAEFISFHGGSGIYRSQAVEDAIAIAEAQIGDLLSSALVPTEFIDEFDWPVDQNKMFLRKVRLISVTSVEGLYSNGDCTWQTSDECSTILDNRMSIIRIRDPWRQWCSGLRCPERMRVTYQAGFTAAEVLITTMAGMQLRAAIFNWALGLLQIGIGLNAQGNLFISNFTAANYSETRQLPEMSGAVNIMNQHILMAKELLRGSKVTVKRPIPLRPRNLGRAC